MKERGCGGAGRGLRRVPTPEPGEGRGARGEPRSSCTYGLAERAPLGDALLALATLLGLRVLRRTKHELLYNAVEEELAHDTEAVVHDVGGDACRWARRVYRVG